MINCVGLFYYRDVNVLKNCIKVGINYIDISDYRGFICKVLEYFEVVKKVGVIVIINIGIFLGIFNSLFCEFIEKFDELEEIYLSYVVGGFGGVGVIVMWIIFLGL